MFDHVNPPESDRNAKATMVPVGTPSTKMTYAKNGTTGAPVRIFRTSAPMPPDRSFVS